MEHTGIYKSPAVQTPTIQKLGDICRRLGIEAEESDLHTYRDLIADGAGAYDVVDSLPEPTLPVKYPRLPGYRPSQEENPLNAWYWKSEIRGASSGKLLGKKLAIKDNICVAGVPMMNGSRVLEGYVPEFDATVITRILDEGGTITGKSACEHLCYSGSSFTSDKGAILNPHDNTRSAGGSSGGSAALVANGEVDMALGGDQGGSCRLPACYCGIVGLKPTYGLVPYTGAISIATSVDHLGPLARTVRDCALLLEVIAGYDDGLDIRQKPMPNLPRYTELLTGDLSGLKVGLVKEGFRNIEPDVDQIVRNGATMLQQKGAHVQEISVPMHETARSIWSVMCGEGTYGQMVENAGHPVDSGPSFHPTSTLEVMARGYRTHMNDMSPTMKFLSVQGEYMKQAYHNRYFHKASNLARTARAAIDDVLKEYDVIVMPTIPFKADKLPSKDAKLKECITKSVNNVANTGQYNITGHPALSINAGFSDGLPVGMMIVGRHFDDAVVLNVAYAYEQLRDQH